MNYKVLAKKLPFSIQQGLKYIFGVIPAQFRFGKVFWDTYNFLQKSQWWSRKQLEEYQMQQLSNLLHHSYENVAYYRKVFEQLNLKPNDIQTLDDLKKIPCLSKDDFKQHFNEFVAKNVNVKNLLVSHTSGTSGKSLQFYTNSLIGQKEWAFICHQWSRVGYKPGDKRVELRGSIINNKNKIEYNPNSKVLRLSPCIDNKEVAKYYINSMKEFKALFLHGYPSAIAFFCHIIKKYGLVIPFKLKAILFASEKIYGWEREIVKEVFNCKVFSHYGMAEQVVLSGECENSLNYHCLPQYGITEFDVKTGEIIGTGFLNNINPFIRYRTTDIANLSNNTTCNDCSRQYYPVISKIQGRLEDFIITSKGIPISPAVITHPLKDIKTIKNIQIIQKSLNEIIIKIVTWENITNSEFDREINYIKNSFKKMMGDDMNICIEVVKEILISKSGKFKWIISKVSKNFLQNEIMH